METKRQRSENLNRLDKEHIVYLGRLAIRADLLGINDPMTHLYQYLEKGESALVGIKEDIETDIAERLPKTPFVNSVDFEFTGNDFISVKDKVSMKSMTNNNLQILKEEAVDNPALQAEYIRAEIESQEVKKLIDWYKSAPIGSNLIFESLPIGTQKFAITRIYKKDSDNRLEGCFMSLYNSSVDQFNQLHKSLSTNVPICKNETEILQNNYEFYDPSLLNSNDFIDHYAKTYDKLLKSKDNKNYSFGIETDKNNQKKNGIQKVRNQSRLTSTYLDTVKILASSNGIATPKLIQINDRLNTGYKLAEKQNISTKIAHDILSNVILGIASAIDKADEALLTNLLDNASQSNDSSEANFATVTYYADQAKTSNETYASNGCPEYTRNSTDNHATNNADSESSMIEQAFNINRNLPNNFGKAKIGVCRIPNCPSHGEISWWPDKTLVGGCDICLCCHKLFGKGKSPQETYAKNEIAKKKQVKNRRKIKQLQSIKTAA